MLNSVHFRYSFAIFSSVLWSYVEHTCIDLFDGRTDGHCNNTAETDDILQNIFLSTSIYFGNYNICVFFDRSAIITTRNGRVGTSPYKSFERL